MRSAVLKDELLSPKVFCLTYLPLSKTKLQSGEMVFV